MAKSNVCMETCNMENKEFCVLCFGEFLDPAEHEMQQDTTFNTINTQHSSLVGEFALLDTWRFA